VILRDRAAALLTGLAAGVAGGLLGVGGGIVLVPILTTRFKLTQHQAHATSLAVIGATALSSLVVYGALASVAWRIAVPVALASMITVRFGARLAGRLSSVALARSFAAFLVLVALRVLWHPQPSVAISAPAGVPALALHLAIGALCGLIAGWMGVGGGIIAVPAFTLLLGLTQRVAQGTSLAMILAAAPVGTIENARRGRVAWPLVPMLALGAIAGGPLASWCAHFIPDLLLARCFAVFLVISAAHTWIRSGRRVSAT
jgi:uncharacterized protein